MSRQPNILFITSDQHRGDTMGCMGHQCIRTPHLDMLADEGTCFENAYSDCPVCIPARTTMITGIRSSVYGIPAYAEHERIERDRELFLGSLMTAAGYQTELVGKTHWHTEPDFRAGFEHWTRYSGLNRERLLRMGRTGRLHGIGANEFSPTCSQFPPELQSTDWAVDRGLEFLEEREKSQPFFLWISVIDPHPPCAIHEPYYSMYDGEDIPMPPHGAWAEGEQAPYAFQQLRFGNAHAQMNESALRKARGVYYGMITNIDHQIGRLFGFLKRIEGWEDTVVIYTTDHGDQLGDHGTFFKSTFLEGATHIPFIMRCPAWLGAERGQRTRAAVGLDDLLPTFCELAGVDTPSDVTGASLMPLVRNEEENLRPYYHGEISNQHMIFDGRYKYCYFVDDGRELLFDKDSDPLDENDLSADAGLVAPLRQQLLEELQNRGHEHVRDGALVNLKRTVQPGDEHRGLDWMGMMP